MNKRAKQINGFNESGKTIIGRRKTEKKNFLYLWKSVDFPSSTIHNTQQHKNTLLILELFIGNAKSYNFSLNQKERVILSFIFDQLNVTSFSLLVLQLLSLKLCFIWKAFPFCSKSKSFSWKGIPIAFRV